LCLEYPRDRRKKQKKLNKMITENTTFEDLLDEIPASFGYLMDKGIKCFACGEPIWGTLGGVSKEKGFTDEQIQVFIRELNKMLENKE
jgi:hypothetical protein